MVFWVIFEDPESLERIPSKGGQFVFRPPKLIGEKHEISMEELESLAQSEDYLEDFDAIEQAEHQKGKDPTLGGGRIVRGGWSMLLFRASCGDHLSAQKKTWLYQINILTLFFK